MKNKNTKTKILHHHCPYVYYIITTIWEKKEIKMRPFEQTYLHTPF